MFIAALFIRAKKWKQPKWPSHDEWIIKMWLYLHNRILFGHKQEWRTDTQYNMDEP